MKLITSVLIFSLFAISAIAQTTPRCGHFSAAPVTTTNDSIDVLHYDINLDIVYLSKKKISGFADLKITTHYNGLSKIKLDLLRLTVDSLNLDGQSISSWNYNDTILDFNLANAINIGDTVLLRVYYHGSPGIDPSGWGGFYFTNDSTFAFNLGIGMQDNPHNYGRVWFPCVDDFSDRATYEMKIAVKNGNKAICNGTLLSTTGGSNSTVYHWDLHHDIPAYLASVAVGPYVAVRDTFNSVNGPVPIAIYVKSNMVAQAQASFANLKQILAAFEYYYGPYRWERVGYVGVPFGSGAMEHVTNIAIGLGYINGTLTYETLFAHELSHHWFGDLVTCASAGDMWLNEGWAVFSEAMYQEMVYGKEAYKNNMRALMYDVLKNTANRDGGYYALANIPHNLTYGSTIYDKGGMVAHALRAYLGDDLFFDMLHDYMNQKAFTDQSITQFRDFITNNTGVNVNDFFASRVDEPGFVHFAIDSFEVQTGVAPFKVKVWMRQRLKHKPNYANSNRVPVSFMDNQWNRIDTMVVFSGQTGSMSFDIPFKPEAVFCDLDERLGDATTDYAKVIKSAGLLDLPLAFAKLDVNYVNDSALVQITYNWLGPDSTGIHYPGLRISSNRYWTVNGIYPTAFDAEIQFRYLRTPGFDNDIIKNKQDSLVVLYRPHGSMAWRPVKFEKQGNWIAGYIKVPHVRNGDYVLAVYDYKYLGIRDRNLQNEAGLKLKIKPNPAQGPVSFEINSNKVVYLMVYDSSGRQIDRIAMQQSADKSSGVWHHQQLASGRYFIVLFDRQNKPVYRSSVIISQ
jgi:aminopeptidase N